MSFASSSSFLVSSDRYFQRKQKAKESFFKYFIDTSDEDFFFEFILD
jgi:hypothetical protein